MDEEGSASSAQTASSPKCPKCGSEQIVGDECTACGIYISKYLESQQKSAVQYESESDIEESTSVAAVSSPVEMSSTDESNPYATPEAALDKSTVSKDGQGSLEGGINGDYDFTIGEIFSESWERTKGAKWTFLLAWLFYFVIAIVVSALISYVMPDSQVLMDQGRFTEGMIWSILPSLITIPILYPLMAGITLLGIHRAVDADISATSIFSHYRKVIPLTILTIVVYIFTILGLMLMILPGIYLAVAYMMAVALMIDRDMGVWEAMESSRKAITRHWFKVFFLYLSLGLLMIAAILPVSISIALNLSGPFILIAAMIALISFIWFVPLSSILHGVMYKYMFGVESVE